MLTYVDDQKENRLHLLSFFIPLAVKKRASAHLKVWLSTNRALDQIQRFLQL